ncbi:MAG: hypothetical protein R3E32_11380 [Chitinophagales bacterium]
MLQKKPPKAETIEGFLSPKKERNVGFKSTLFLLNGINPHS